MEEDHRIHQARRWVELQAEFLSQTKTVTALELPSGVTDRLFSVNDGSTERYPVFQMRGDEPIPEIEIILGLLRPKFSDWEIAMWFTAPNTWLGDWRTPADVLELQPTKVVDAARHATAEQVF
jgi:hypothetical protein